MSCTKKKITLRASGVASFDSTSITTSVTSDAIEMTDTCGFVLNAWFASAVTGAPLLTIEGSNTTDAASFKVLDCAENIPLPEIITKSVYLPRYIRFVYDANGATGGNKNLDFYIVCP